MNKISKIVFIALLALVQFGFAQTVKVDTKIEKYKKVVAISGNANSIGSDTMNNLMALWLEGFRKHYPWVSVQIEGKGSSTAPLALIEASAQFGPMSREMKSKEKDTFDKKYGFKPTRIRTSLDALAIFVNKDNPIKCLSLERADAVFSKTRKHGFAKEVKTWGDLGLSGSWAGQPVRIFGRNSASGSYGFFKKKVLKKGDFKDSVKEQPGSASVVQGITEDKYAIGYSGIGYKTSGVKTVPLAKKEGADCFDGSYANVFDKNYPLARFLNLYIINDPVKPMDPLVKEFIKYILSYEGQEIVVKDGYLPLPYDVVVEELAKLK